MGLDYTMRLTHDWRVKQNVLVDAGALRGWFSNERNADLRRHFKPGLVEDLRENCSFKPEYSLDADKTISGLAKNFTPEKSELLLRLTAFEDVKFIYQAIIAKLFVIEKMEAGGITQSSIDAAEAQFMTLYSITNNKEKYILSSDFFSKLASILYYKNTIVSYENDESIFTTFYLFDIDLLALLDDYCCYTFGESDSSDAISIKDDVREFLYSSKTSEVIKKVRDWNELPANARNIYYDAVGYGDLFQRFACIFKNGKEPNKLLDNVRRYFNYLDQNSCFSINDKWQRLEDCYNRRSELCKDGYKLPCSACKYANRSLVILMMRLFDYKEDSESKVMTLLRNTSHQDLKNQRPEILSQLALSSEQLADIMMSCACTGKNAAGDKENTKSIGTDSLSPESIKLLVDLTKNVVPLEEKNNAIDAFGSTNEKKLRGKLDRVLLYYWAACRYYDIASMHHEAVHCIWRITSVIEKYLTVIAYNKNRYGGNVDISNVSKDTILLLEQLFMQASRIVGRQFDNYNSVEIHEIKWLFHFEHVDDIDLTNLTQFPDLQSIFISIVNSKISVYQLSTTSVRGEGTEWDGDDLENYVGKMYEWITKYRHERTFKSEVELNYLKARLNRVILNSILGGYDVKQHHFNKGVSIGYYYYNYYRKLKEVLDDTKQRNTLQENYYLKELLGVKNINVQSALDIIDFLIYDSITCLCNIINTLPPHNQISTFPNSFIANVYEDLWEWSKYYAMMYDMYLYYRWFLSGNESGMEKMTKYFTEADRKRSLVFMQGYAMMLKNRGVVCKDDFGYRYSKLFMNLRHDIDDATIHHILIDYSAEMAIKYYRAARGVNCEGQEYKNLINNMYILDDDLCNDTCQSNLADERYLLNSGVINQKRVDMQGLYKDSRINAMKSYEGGDGIKKDEFVNSKIKERFSDSLFLNTEY